MWVVRSFPHTSGLRSVSRHAAFPCRRERRHRHKSLHISASERPGTNRFAHSVHGRGSCFTRQAALSDAAFSGFSSRHRCTAALWHRAAARTTARCASGGHANLPRRSVPTPTCAHGPPGPARGTGGRRSSSPGGAVTGAAIYGDVDGITTMPRPRAMPPPNGAAESRGAHAGTPNQVRRTGRRAHADTSPPASAALPAAAARGPAAPMSG